MQSCTQPRLQSCVCSIADDNSVALLSTSERKSLLLASRHSAPVESIYWRLEEDFILVKCADGRLYVWQIETGLFVCLSVAGRGGVETAVHKICLFSVSWIGQTHFCVILVHLLWVYVCVCVCVREREREREKGSDSLCLCLHRHSRSLCGW